MEIIVLFVIALAIYAGLQWLGDKIAHEDDNGSF